MLNTTPPPPPPSIAVGSSLVPASLDVRTLIEQLQQLRKAPQSELDWNLYCRLMSQLCKATHAAVVSRVTGTPTIELLGRASELESWSPLQTLPPGMDLMEKAAANGYAHAPAQAPDGQTWLVLVIALQGLSSCFLMLNIKMQERSLLNELTLRALLCTDFDRTAISASAIAPPSELTGMLDLAAEVMQQSTFHSACLTLVNGMTTEWGLVQASIGWVTNGHIRVVAISHLDRFERNSQQTQLIEKALVPALVQGHEIWSPAPDDGILDTGAMTELAEELNAQRVAAVPIRDAHGMIHAVMLLVFSSGSRPVSDLNHLLLALELIQPRLTDLWTRSLSPWQRLVLQLNKWSKMVFGPDHGMLKLAAVAVGVLLLYAAFGTWAYRVDASAQLNTESTRLISAQFDGRIDQVYTTAGELVKEGALLLSLDTRELEQQRSEFLAEISKGEAETNKHRADGRLAEMEIGQARLDQSLAKMKRVEYYLQQTQSKAPFEGVIVEGEKKDLLGAPVKKGDKIFRIAKIEGLYATLMVTERQMRYIQPGASGEVSLLSHPDNSIPVRINSVIPVAQVKGQEGNEFMITAELLQTPQAWWRPGMTGLARIDAGQKNIAWILTHRIIDKLRLMFWW